MTRLLKKRGIANLRYLVSAKQETGSRSCNVFAIRCAIV